MGGEYFYLLLFERRQNPLHQEPRRAERRGQWVSAWFPFLAALDLTLVEPCTEATPWQADTCACLNGFQETVLWHLESEDTWDLKWAPLGNCSERKTQLGPGIRSSPSLRPLLMPVPLGAQTRPCPELPFTWHGPPRWS